MHVLCKHDAMSCRSFVCTWVLEYVWVLNPDIHRYQWKIRNVSSLSVSDLSLLLLCIALLHFPTLPPLCLLPGPHIVTACSESPTCCTFRKSLFQYLQVMIFFFFMRHLQSIPYHIHRVLFISQHLSTTAVILNIYFYVI